MKAAALITTACLAIVACTPGKAPHAAESPSAASKPAKSKGTDVEHLVGGASLEVLWHGSEPRVPIRLHLADVRRQSFLIEFESTATFQTAPDARREARLPRSRIVGELTPKPGADVSKLAADFVYKDFWIVDEDDLAPEELKRAREDLRAMTPEPQTYVFSDRGLDDPDSAPSRRVEPSSDTDPTQWVAPTFVPIGLRFPGAAIGPDARWTVRHPPTDVAGLPMRMTVTFSLEHHSGEDFVVSWESELTAVPTAKTPKSTADDSGERTKLESWNSRGRGTLRGRLSARLRDRAFRPRGGHDARNLRRRQLPCGCTGRRKLAGRPLVAGPGHSVRTTGLRLPAIAGDGASSSACNPSVLRARAPQ